MDLKQIILLAVQLSILSTVFGFGLRAGPDEILYLLHRPRLLVRSILAVSLIMPIVAVALTMIFEFREAVEITLVALSISPVPPLLPTKQTRAGGRGAFGVALMAWLAILSIVTIPLSLVLLQFIFRHQFAIDPATIARLVVKSTLAPLAVGMLVRFAMPGLAQRLDRPAALVAKVLLPIAVLLLLGGAASAMWALVGDGTLFALVIFTLIGLAVGHVLGGPDPEHAVVLALATASRHPAIALTIAAANYPGLKFGALILLYLLVNAIVAIPYVMWQHRRIAETVQAA